MRRAGDLEAMRVFWIVALCALVGGCAAGAPEVRARLGQEYIGKNVDALVIQWGPPTSMFRMNSGQGSYVWQLSSVTGVTVNRGGGPPVPTAARSVSSRRRPGLSLSSTQKTTTRAGLDL
jgi:hypothetical protein